MSCQGTKDIPPRTLNFVEAISYSLSPDIEEMPIGHIVQIVRMWLCCACFDVRCFYKKRFFRYS